MTVNNIQPENHVAPEEKKLIPQEIEELNLEEIVKRLPLHEDITCGLWIFKGNFLQKFANKKVYVFLYGVIGCIFTASFAYFNGIITTLEKRFKIPSRNMGIISVGNDISQLLVSVFINYYASKGHRPRWIGFGIYSVVIFCLLICLPQFLYGSGEDALFLTKEYGAIPDANLSLEVLELQKHKTLCTSNNSTDNKCQTEEGSLIPQVILFIAQFISGTGGSLYFSLGVAYMDDNIKKSKTPALISLSYFLRMLGPALGYGLASMCLKFYISPSLTPTIDNSDPRWLGAWWLGWIIISVPLFIFGTMLAMFPKSLPRAYARKIYMKEKLRLESKEKEIVEEVEEKASLKDMMITFKRLVRNPVLMYNNLAAVFYFFGYMPYWIFMPKYIEVQYRQSASVASFVTGSVGLVFSAFGILIAGIVISKTKPGARYLAAWNVLVGAISVIGLISYIFLGCDANDKHMPVLPSGDLEISFTCNADCNCDYVKYSPVCAPTGKTYISACHAGCQQQQIFPNGSKIYTNCKCVNPTFDHVAEQLVMVNSSNIDVFTQSTPPPLEGGYTVPGYCPVDCQKMFFIFLAVVCVLKFSGSTGRASNLLVAIRCVDEKDKPVSMGFSLMIMSLCAFIPSPITFGVILDSTCLVWGKTCSGTGNCWLYNGEALRYLMNLTAAVFVAIGTIFDVVVWYYVKDLKIFDEEVELDDMDMGGF